MTVIQCYLDHRLGQLLAAYRCVRLGYYFNLNFLKGRQLVGWPVESVTMTATCSMGPDSEVELSLSSSCSIRVEFKHLHLLKF